MSTNVQLQQVLEVSINVSNATTLKNVTTFILMIFGASVIVQSEIVQRYINKIQNGRYWVAFLPSGGSVTSSVILRIYMSVC